MIATATPLSAAIVYLALLFVQGFGPPDDSGIDFLQDGAPAWHISVGSESTGSRAIYRITLVPLGSQRAADDGVVIRAEQSELSSQNYLVYEPGSNVPRVISIGDGLAALASAPRSASATLELDSSSQGLAGSSDETSPGSTLYVLRRGSTIMLSAPEVGALLVGTRKP